MRSGWSLAAAIVGGLGAASVPLACRPATEPELDLVAETAVASSHAEAGVPELGMDNQRQGLIEGFGFRDTEPGEAATVVGVGDHSAVQVRLRAAVPRTLVLSVQPLGELSGPLEIAWNGAVIERIELRRRAREYEVAIPARMQERGANRLEIRYPEHRRPAAVVWDAIQILPSGEGEPHVEAGDPPRLVLPWFGQVDYYLRLGPDAMLGAASVASRVRNDRGHLQVRVTREAAGAERQAEISPGTDVRVPLGSEPGLARLTLVAVPDGPGAPDGGLSLTAPRVLGAPPAGERSESGPSARVPGASAGEGPSILLYVVDTLRADHTTLYGYDRPTTPQLERFAADAVTFDHAQAQSSWTKPSVTSMLTGLLPQYHGINDREDELTPADATLPGILQRAGYETFAVVTNSTIGRTFGFDLGFHEYEQLGERRTAEVHALSDVVNERFLDWLDRRRSARPFFAWLHSTDPHEPYVPREPYASAFLRGRAYPEIVKGTSARRLLESSPEVDEASVRDWLIDRYDAEVAFNDASFGQLLAALRERGMYDDMVIVFASDHGEEFLDHGGFSHGATLFQEVLRVPLVLKLPGNRDAGARVAAGVQHIDLLPTLLGLVGVPVPAGATGEDLRSLVGVDPGAPRPLVSHVSLGRPDEPSESILLGPDKLVRRVLAGGAERRSLYELSSDPTEHEELAGRHPVLAGWLATELRRIVLGAPLARASRARLDPDLERTLRALGYIQ